MKYLICGSEGQIGKPLCEYLRKKDHDVVEFDIFRNQKEDLRIENILDSILQNVDFVIFLSFDIGGSKYISKYQDTFDFISNNIRIMEYTFSSLRKYKKKFIFVSTQMIGIAEYSNYGLLKLIGEKYAKALNGICVRLWNIYGSKRNSEIKYDVITDFITQAKKGKIQMLTDGTEVRQFLHINDCCNALYEVSLKYEKVDVSPLCISSFEWITIYDVALLIQKHIQCQIEKSKKKDILQFDKRIEPSPLIFEILEFRPKLSLEEGIKKYIKEI